MADFVYWTGDYGPSWPSQRGLALERDNYTCRHCGVAEPFARLEVHHLWARRLFGSDHASANTLENLLTVCDECHRVIERAAREGEAWARRAASEWPIMARRFDALPHEYQATIKKIALSSRLSVDEVLAMTFEERLALARVALKKSPGVQKWLDASIDVLDGFSAPSPPREERAVGGFRGNKLTAKDRARLDPTNVPGELTGPESRCPHCNRKLGQWSEGAVLATDVAFRVHCIRCGMPVVVSPVVESTG